MFDILAQDPVTLSALIWGAVKAVAFYVGLSYLGQALFGQDVKEAEQPVDTRGRLWNPHTTQQEGLARARCHGRNMHFGNIIGKWTDVDNDEREILFLLLEHGDGPTKGNVADSFWINDQPVANFPAVDVQERVGTMDQTCMTGFEKSKLEYVLPNVELKKEDEGDPYVWTTPNSFFDDIEYTICFPDGLIKYYVDGGRTSWKVYTRVRIREHPSGSWTTLFDTYIQAKQTTPLFKKYLVSEQGFSCERGKQYDLEFKRTTVDGHVRRIDKSFLRSIREVVDVAFTHPGKALTGIRAIATTGLSGNIDVKVIREDRLVNVFDGTTWTIEYSRNRAWVVYDILTQPIIGGNGGAVPWFVARYEGISPANLNLEFFYNWSVFCSTQVLDGYGGTEDRLACDIKVDYLTNVWDLANEIAQIGRAHLYWSGSTLTGWIDKAVTGPTDLVTMDNTMRRSWKNKWSDRTELCGLVEVFYQDKRSGYERTSATWPKATAGSYKRPKAIEGVGITTYGTAIHVANHALTRNALIKNINGFRQYKDAFRHTLGEVIRLQHKTPHYGHGYRVVDTPTASTMVLDRIATFVNVGDLLYVRTYNEVAKVVATAVYTVTAVVGATVTIAETWDPTPAPNNIVAIGRVVTRRIVKIETTEKNYFDIEVETYDPVLYDADNLDPDAPNKGYIWSQPPGTLAKPVSHDDVVDLVNRVLPPQPDIEIPLVSNVAWTGSGGDTGTWAARDGDEPITVMFRGTTYEITPDSTTDEFIYWDENFTTEFRTTNLVTVAIAAERHIMCRNIDGVVYPVHGMMLAEIGILLAGFLRVGTADIENLAVTTIKIDNNAVTLMVAAYTAASAHYNDAAWHEAQTVSLTTIGQPVLLLTSVQWASDPGEDMQIRIQRDDLVTVYATSVDTLARYGNPFSAMVVDEPGAGAHTYDLDLRTLSGVGDDWIEFQQRSLVAKEVKK